MRKSRDRVVMVTGAASGIGKACALAFADQGCDLVICDLQKKELDDVAEEIRSSGRGVLAMTADVSKENDIKKLAEEAFKKFGRVDVAMSNAGIAIPGITPAFEKTDWEKIINVNFYGCVHVVRYFVPPMIERKEGHLIVNASGWGLMGAPYNALYVTSKHALVGYSECLRAEIAQHNVGVTTLAAGVVKTNIFVNAELKGFKESARDLVKLAGGMSPERFAKKVVRGVQWNRGLLVISLMSKITWLFKRTFPRTFEAFLRLFARFSNKFLEEN